MEQPLSNKNLKHTSFGWIPKEWNILSLSQICDLIQDGTHFSPSSKNGNYKYITSKNVRFGKLDFSNCDYISEEEHKAIYKRCPVKKGDILFTKDGAKTGNAAINHFDEEFSLLSSVAILRSDKQKACNDYILQTILSPRMQYIIKDLMAGQAITRLTLEKIKSLQIPVPQLNEQKKIAEILSTWDSAIETCEKLISAKQTRKRALMQRLLTGKQRFPQFAGQAWKEVRLGNIFRERCETFAQYVLKQKAEGKKAEDLELVAITGKNGVVWRDTLEKRDTSNPDKSKYLRICRGDIGYNTMRMWQGVSGLSEIEGIVSPAYTIVTPTEKIDGRFASYFFKHLPVIHLLWRFSQGLVDDTLNLKFPHFAQIKVEIPPTVEEQKRIAEIFSACDKEIELLENKRDALKQQKRGLMQKLLTGKVRVKVDSENTQEA